MPIDLTTLWAAVNEGLVVLLGGLGIVIGGFLIYALHKYAKFLSAAQQEKLSGIVNNGINLAIQYALNVATEQEKKVVITPDSVVTRIAGQYVIDHLGGTLDKLGKSPSDLSQMIIARLPSPPVLGDLTDATVKTTLVTTQELPTIPKP